MSTIPRSYQYTVLQNIKRQQCAKQHILLTEETNQTTYHRELVKEKVNLGHEIIVAGDFNDDLNNNQGTTMTFMRNLGLKEIMLTAMDEKGPATHIRGKNTIDGIFATQGISLEAGKYTTFHESPSDHRWIVVDITERSLLGIKRYEDCTKLTRRVTARIPSLKVSFQHLLEKQILMYDLPQKMHHIYEKAIKNNHLTQEDELVYEQIEHRMQRAVTYADRHCRKVRRGNIPFSPMQKRLMGEIIILRQIRLRNLLKGKKNRPRSKRIHRLIAKYEYKGNTTFNQIDDIDKAIKEASQKYRAFRQDSQSKRWSYLENIAREYDEIDGKGKQHHFRILQRNEETKEYFRRIRLCEGKSRGGGVDKIQKIVNDQVVTIYDKESIEKEIIRVNKEKLLQAHDTPLRDRQISQLLGEQGDFQKWEAILNGIVELPNGIDEGLQLWYKFVTSTEKHDINNFIWTTEEYCNSWMKMKEDKTTLPGIQVAHLKCLDPSTQAADIMSKLALIPLLTGYSPNTWRIGIDSMIPKKVADLRPEKLRLILLMDARFNHNNKLIGKKMMEYGEKHNLLAPEQYGSRKNKSAIDHATNKRFTMDILRQSCTPAIYIANDAKSCYDRIILMVAYITMRNFGIPTLVAQSTISTILNMKHYVRTSYGDSLCSYGGETWDVKPHGCGQGNGYGPALWACISSPLLHILRQQGYGTVITTPLSDTSIHMAAFSFVDDTDIIQTGQQTQGIVTENDINNLYSTTQQAIQTWSSTLAATGGALEPTKTFYVPIIPGWKGSRTELRKDRSHHQISLVNNDGSNTHLVKKDPQDSFFSLGLWQSPTGDETRQTKHMQDIICAWGHSTSTHKISWKHARIAVKSTIGRTLYYPLLATSMNETQCARLQRHILDQTLGKMGIVRTTPTLLATAPVTLGGFGVISIETVQLIRHISLLLQHGQDPNSVTGKLLISTLEYNVLETGYAGDPMQVPPVTYTTRNTWISNTLNSMSRHDIKIRTTLSGLERWTDDDQFIMELLKDYGTNALLATINKVRMFLKVVTVSDLLTADGTTFDRDCIQGKRSGSHPNPSHFRYGWPSVPSPTSAERAIWTSAIVFQLQINIDQPRTRYGHILWRDNAPQYAQWLYSERDNRLYQRMSSRQWGIWTPVLETRRHRTRLSASFYTKSLGQIDTIPNLIRLASIRFHGLNRVSLINTSRHVFSNYASGPPPQVTTRISNYQRAQAAFIYNIVMHNGIIYSDGSYANGRSSFAWVAQPPHFEIPLADIDFSSFWWNSNVVQGPAEEQHSYRAELGGILDAIVQTNAVCETARIAQGSCTLYCDSKGALAASFGSKQPTPRWASFDLVYSIKRALATSPIHWRYVHVKGHQDKHKKFERLDNIPQGNILADHLASKKLQEQDATIPDKSGLWTLTIQGQIICGNIDKRLYMEMYRPKMIAKWAHLLKLDRSDTGADWTSFFRSFSGHPPHKQIMVVKFNARLLPVGTNLKRRRHADTDTCFYCHEEETHAHIIQCRNPELQVTFDAIIEEIKEWLTQHTSEDIAKDILLIAQYYRNRQWGDNPLPESTDRVQQQIALGHDAFFAGLWTEQWKQDLDNFFRSRGSKREAGKWICHIINKIQSIPLEMWKCRNDMRNRDKSQSDLAIQQGELNTLLEEIFDKKPHDRLMAHCDSAYFRKHSKDTIRSMTVHRKTNWITGAKLILSKYDRIDTPQAARFTSYFQWDRG